LPLSITFTEGVWVVACNDETRKLMGERFCQVSQGKTKEEAITKFFQAVSPNYLPNC